MDNIRGTGRLELPKALSGPLKADNPPPQAAAAQPVQKAKTDMLSLPKDGPSSLLKLQPQSVQKEPNVKQDLPQSVEPGSQEIEPSSEVPNVPGVYTAGPGMMTSQTSGGWLPSIGGWSRP